ncbi:hypothetical protein HOA92_02585 [archaeon]|jgi:hypothetical protein|nr:hypothetical protein [archaeon]MBT6761901.1 hypothetical protein [archaeon]
MGLHIAIADTLRSETNDLLYHEASHNLHYIIDGELTKEWYAKLDFERPKNARFRGCVENAVVNKEGLLSLHALMDYNELDGFKERYSTGIDQITGEPFQTVMITNGVNVCFYDQKISDESTKLHIARIMDLPENIRSALTEIRIDPTLKICYAQYQHVSTEFLRITEDIATSAEQFNLAHYTSGRNRTVLKKLAENPKTQLRLELLEKYEFIPERVAADLKYLAKVNADMRSFNLRESQRPFSLQPELKQHYVDHSDKCLEQN